MVEIRRVYECENREKPAQSPILSASGQLVLSSGNRWFELEGSGIFAN